MTFAKSQETLVKFLREGLELKGRNNHNMGAFICDVDVGWEAFCILLKSKLEDWDRLPGLIDHREVTDDIIKLEFSSVRFGAYSHFIASKAQFGAYEGQFAVYIDIF